VRPGSSPPARAPQMPGAAVARVDAWSRKGGACVLSALSGPRCSCTHVCSRPCAWPALRRAVWRLCRGRQGGLLLHPDLRRAPVRSGGARALPAGAGAAGARPAPVDGSWSACCCHSAARRRMGVPAALGPTFFRGWGEHCYTPRRRVASQAGRNWLPLGPTHARTGCGSAARPSAWSPADGRASDPRGPRPCAGFPRPSRRARRRRPRPWRRARAAWFGCWWRAWPARCRRGAPASSPTCCSAC